VPDSTTMRRAARRRRPGDAPEPPAQHAPALRTTVRVVTACAALSVGAAVLSSCGSAKATPGPPKANFTAGAQLTVTQAPNCPNATAAGCPAYLTLTKPGGAASLTSVPNGTVMVVRNDTTTDHRVEGSTRAQPVFDTGTMHPSDTTTVVLTTTGRMTVTLVGSSTKTTLTVEAPKPKT